MEQSSVELAATPARLDVERVAGALAQLAAVKSGFSKPPDLSHLGVLLSLGVVGDLVGDQRPRAAAQAIALRSVLDRVTDRISNTRTREQARIYLFLDEDEGLQTGTLSRRRREIEDRFDYGRDRYRQGDEAFVRAIVAGELVRFEIEEAYRRMRGAGGETLVRIIRTNEQLRDEMVRLAVTAERFLGCTGSRSREAAYLETIEQQLEEHPALTHFRVLVGDPHHAVLKPHLRQLLRLSQSPRRKAVGGEVRIGMFRDALLEPERFVVANDREALTVLPPFSEVGNFDTAVVFQDESSVAALQRYVVDLFNGSETLDEDTVARLEVTRR